jgi:hypothetical protein
MNRKHVADGSWVKADWGLNQVQGRAMIKKLDDGNFELGTLSLAITINSPRSNGSLILFVFGTDRTRHATKPLAVLAGGVYLCVRRLSLGLLRDLLRCLEPSARGRVHESFMILCQALDMPPPPPPPPNSNSCKPCQLKSSNDKTLHSPSAQPAILAHLKLF